MFPKYIGAIKMQILWKKYKNINFDSNLDECGIEQGTPGTGYKYEVVKKCCYTLYFKRKWNF